MKHKCPKLRNAQITTFLPKSCFQLACEVFKVYQIRSKDPVKTSTAAWLSRKIEKSSRIIEIRLCRFQIYSRYCDIYSEATAGMYIAPDRGFSKTDFLQMIPVSWEFNIDYAKQPFLSFYPRTPVPLTPPLILYSA